MIDPVFGTMGPGSIAATAIAETLYVAICAFGAVRLWSARDRLPGLLRAKVPGEPPSEAPGSFSRVAAMLGAYSLTALCIILGGFVISMLWTASGPGRIEEVIGKLGTLLWVEAVLFAPYAANQLSRIGNFRSDGQAGNAQTGTTIRPRALSSASGTPQFDPNTMRR